MREQEIDIRKRIAAAPRGRNRWILLYDDDCGFCKWAVSLITSWDRHRRLAPRSIQSRLGHGLLSDLSPGSQLASMHLASPSGERFSGGAAATPLLRLLPGGSFFAWVAQKVPRLTDSAYDWVAAHRSQLSKAVPERVKLRASARLAETAD